MTMRKNLKFKPNPKRKTITIFKNRWVRSKYADNHGAYCALGYAGLQLYGESDFFAGSKSLGHPITKIEDEVISVNDNCHGKERINRLRDLFKKAGYKLIFK